MYALVYCPRHCRDHAVRPDHIICMHSQTTLQSLVTCNSSMLISTSTSIANPSPWLSFAVIAVIVVTFFVVCEFAIAVGHDVGGGR